MPYHLTQRKQLARCGKTHGPQHCVRPCPTCRWLISSGFKSSLRTADLRRGQMPGFGASIVSLLRLCTTAFVSRRTWRILSFLRLWRRAWKSRLPMKIRVFVWLLLQKRLMTRSYRQRMAPASETECALCTEAVKDCEHLFVTCLFAASVWQLARVAQIDTSSLEAFWRSIGDGPYRQNGRASLPFYGPYGVTVTKSSSGDASPQSMSSSMTCSD